MKNYMKNSPALFWKEIIGRFYITKKLRNQNDNTYLTLHSALNDQSAFITLLILHNGQTIHYTYCLTLNTPAVRHFHEY